MTIKDYQYINLIPTGSTYEYEICKYFNINTDRSKDEVRKDLSKKIEVKDWVMEKPEFVFSGRTWMIEKDFLDCTFEQWIRLETLIAKENNLENLHKLIAIYCRPTTKKWNGKTIIKPFILREQEHIANELLNLPIDIAQTIIVFFYHIVKMSLRNIVIPSLNQMNLEINNLTKKK